MKRIAIIIFILAMANCLPGQVRNGWRSVFDKDGRLTRMHFYQEGVSVVDSGFYFQYYTENLLKALITGEIESQSGQIDGSIALFDHSGKLTSYSMKTEGYNVFDVECDYDENCKALFSESFETHSDNWVGDNFHISKGELVIENESSFSAVEYKPPFPIDLSREFALKLVMPVKGNAAKIGLALNWQDADNYLLFEISFGQYYAIEQKTNGKEKMLTETRVDIEKPDENYNVLVIQNDGNNLIMELNSVIQEVIPLPDFESNKIALISKACGKTRFSEILYRYDLNVQNDFFNSLWVGRGSGFFIATDKVITTYDAVIEANRIRITGIVGDKNFSLPARLINYDEKNNLAILRIDSIDFLPFHRLPFGYTNTIPVSESKVFSIGYPNAVSGIYMEPQMLDGIVLPVSSNYGGSRLLEMPFRYGMIGSPVFDNDANLIGMYSRKGIDLSYTEIVDFQDNSRTIKAEMGQIDRKMESPYKNATVDEKIKALSSIVVIVESSVFEKNE